MPDKIILIVDADTASLKYLAHMLQEQHYSVQGANSGKEGLIYAWRDRPDLIVFDPAIKDISTEEFIQKLQRDPRSANTPLLALSSDPSLEKKAACLGAGCSEYILKSGEAVAELPGVIVHLLGDTQIAVTANGNLIVFLSAKGGTGTSSLCANYAMTISQAKPEAKVVVVDLVLPIGSIAPIVGYDGKVDLVSVADLPSAETTGEYFRKHLPEIKLWQFQLLAGATDPEGANNLQVARIPEILTELRAVYDYVVLDMGRALSRISLPIIQQADLLVLTVSTDKNTLTLTRKVWDYLQTQDIDAQNVFAILNRSIGREGLTKSEAEKMIELPIKTTMPYMGSDFTLANNLNQPIIAKYPGDTAAIIFKDTANKMLELVDKLHNK